MNDRASNTSRDVWNRTAKAAPALGAGVLAASTGLSPTGSRGFDVVLVVAAVAVWVFAASPVGWRPALWTVVAAIALSGSIWGITVGSAAVLLMVAWRSTWEHAMWQRSVVLGALAQALAHVRTLGGFGWSTLAAIAMAAFVLVLGLAGQPETSRRALRRAGLVGGLAGGLCLVAFVATAGAAASGLVRGGREARASLRLLDQGEIDAAIDGFAHANELLHSADGWLHSWWGMPARLLPLVAQQQRSISRLASETAAATEEINAVLRSTDYDALGVHEGRIDLNAIRALDGPLQDLSAALESLDAGVDRARGDWVLPPINSVINTLTRDVTKRQEQLLDMTEAVRMAPNMLGAEGPRRYFIALTTPAEARGLGGLMGNWAEVTADRGRLTLTKFGRHDELLQAARTTPSLAQAPAEFLASYGTYVTSNTGTLAAGPGVWTNLTVSAHFPWVAETIAALYPQSGGDTVDGVFLMDVFTVAQLMRITGSVVIENLGVEITPDNAVQYLLRDQYLVPAKADRVDLLETLARTTIDRALAGALPSPPRLAALMSPMARGHHLAAWARRPEEQAVFRNANMTKELDLQDDTAVIGFSLYNGNGNKIDAYLNGSAEYEVTTGRPVGTTSGELRLTLHNSAPSAGLPDYVIGNLVGLPRGTNRTTVMIYSSAPITAVTETSGSSSWVPGAERGLYTAAVTLDIPAGASITIVAATATTGADTSGRLPHRLLVDMPPTALPLPLTVRHNGRLLTDESVAESGAIRFRLA